jgi:tetratricopeptide (TPR) repeat protein
MLNPASERMQLGHAARRAGRTGEALDHYRSAVEQDPGSAEAHSVYGLMLLQLDRVGEAEAPLRKAVEIAPGHAALRMNLAQWLAHQGDLDEAVAVVAGIVKDEPQHWWAWERLGELKARLQSFGEASENFRRAAELKPDDPSLLFKLARARFDGGDGEGAERILDEAAKIAPANAAILRLYADLHESRSNWAALEKTANTWARVHPSDPAAWRSLAKAQWESGYPRRAMQNFQKSFDLGGRNAASLATFGRLCLYALELEAAAKALDEAEALDPENSSVLSAKGVLLMWKGRYDEAEDYCRRTLRVSPGDATALKTLTQLSNGHLPEEDVKTLRAVADSSETRTQDRITTLFALADCLDADDRIDEAFAAYERANRLSYERTAIEGITYDPAARTQQTEELISAFDAVPSPTAGITGPRPIFILGMPRSGTTLVESVIGAHSRVAAGGESGGIRWILPEYLARVRDGSQSALPESTWAQWRTFYWQQMPKLDGADAVTDKNPWNFDAFALILRLFPGARIIHVRRNPVETGFSIFRNEFSKLVRFTHRLEDIGHYYGEYARVMAHWERIAGDRFTTIQYEDFTREFDVAGPALLAACGLEWEEACGRFWENKRPVSTISTMQVRRPLGKASVRARAYAAHLAPLVQTLESMSVDLETGRFLDAPSGGPV